MAYMNDPLQKKNQEDQNQNQSQNAGGNIYSTSSSEVSSQVDQKSSPSGNSNNSNTSSNSSGNWVNLNSYLDANQDKAGRYATTFVENDLNKGQDYKNNLQNAQDQYVSSIKNDTAYTYNTNDNNLLDRYLKDSNSLSSDEKNRAVNILKGYQGADYWQNTGDTYGYNNLKKESDDYNLLSSNIKNDNYLKSQMGNNVSSGGKNLNTFILGGSDQSRNVLNNASNQFSELASLLDQSSNTLNTERDNVVNKATENQKAYDKVRQDKKAELENILNSNYALQKASDASLQKSRQEDIWDNNTPVSSDGYFMVRQDLTQTGQPQAQLDRELKELQNRFDSLTGNVSLNGNSKLDSDFQFTDWREANAGEKETQAKRANDYDLLYDDKRWVAAVPADLRENMRRAFILGKIDYGDVKAMVTPYIKSYYGYN